MKKYIGLLLSLAIFLSTAWSVNAQGEDHSLEGDSIYYVLVDRFTNGSSENDFEIDIDDPNAYHGGDIQGVISKLDYIQGLGFTTINLSPIMESNDASYHGFFTEDYQVIEDQFGTFSDLDELVEQAHKRNMKVVMDFVVTHTSPDHTWLQGYEDWIEGTVNNHWGEKLPRPDLNQPKVQQYFYDSAAFWIEKAGIDGYRLYVDEQTPAQFVEGFENKVLEVNENAKVFVDSYNSLNQPSTNSEWKQVASDVFRNAGNSLEPLIELSLTDQDTTQLKYLDSITSTRFTREAVKQEQNPSTRWKLALTYLYTIPGTPVIYQGTEVPMDNGVDRPDHRMAQVNNGDDELRSYMEQLSAIRKEFPALTNGNLEVVENNGAMSLFKRENEEETVYIAINNDTETKTIALTDITKGMQLTGLLQDSIIRPLENGEYRIALERETADIFIVEEDTGLNWLFISFVVLVLGGFVFAVIYLSIKGKRKV